MALRRDAFGKPLTADWEDAGDLLHDGTYDAETTTRGFTGHEHLDGHGLVPGRFLSVDPVIQNLASSQSLNPYSYILNNNPLSGVDPSGYVPATTAPTPRMALFHPVTIRSRTSRTTTLARPPGGQAPSPPDDTVSITSNR